MSSATSDTALRSGTAARWAGHKAFRGIQELTRRVKGRTLPGEIRRVLTWPPVSSGDELGDLLARLGWYLPEQCDIEIPADDLDLTPHPVSWFDEPSQRTSANVRIVAPSQIRMGPDIILVWKDGRRSYFDRRVLKDINRVMIVDPDYLASNEPMGYTALSSQTMSTDALQRLEAQSKHAFEGLIADVNPASNVLMYGTGPSMRDIAPEDVEADLVIACNSAVRDPEWIEATMPKIIAFADPTFHFSPNRYAKAFREDLERAVEISDPYLVTLDRYVPLIARHMPDLLERTIGLSPVGTGDIVIPTPDAPIVVRTANVLTLVMLPVAAAVGQHIAIAGCDGRAKSETYFWRHNPQGQYSDELMATVPEAHPAVFRDRSFGGYYRKHCEILDAQIRALEAANFTVSCATPSLVPALKARM